MRDRVLDYFVISEDLAQAWAIVAACVIGDATFGPHSPVRLIVKANTRTVMVRHLKVPIGFAADLPVGPLPRKGCPRSLCSHQGSWGTELCDGSPSHEADDVIPDVVRQSPAVMPSFHKGDGGDN